LEELRGGFGKGVLLKAEATRRQIKSEN
jgi:hypothetical protein